jgi:hypothetical protein
MDADADTGAPLDPEAFEAPVDDPAGSDEGGDAACWANLVCDDCGGVGNEHRPGCARGEDAASS